MRGEISHGTYGGYHAHRKRGSEPCAACRRANADYSQRLRERPGRRDEESARNAARSRALWRLAHEYPERYSQLFIEEVTRESDRSTRES